MKVITTWKHTADVSTNREGLCVSLHCLSSKQTLSRQGAMNVWQYLLWSVWTRPILAQTCLSRVIHHNPRAAFTLCSTEAWCCLFAIKHMSHVKPSSHSTTHRPQPFQTRTLQHKQANSSFCSVKQVYRKSCCCYFKFVTQLCCCGNFVLRNIALQWSAVMWNTAKHWYLLTQMLNIDVMLNTHR